MLQQQSDYSAGCLHPDASGRPAECGDRVVKISGATYPVKAKLKAMGGRWDPVNGCWWIPEKYAALARELVPQVDPVEHQFTAEMRSLLVCKETNAKFRQLARRHVPEISPYTPRFVRTYSTGGFRVVYRTSSTIPILQPVNYYLDLEFGTEHLCVACATDSNLNEKLGGEWRRWRCERWTTWRIMVAVSRSRYNVSGRYRTATRGVRRSEC